jgi:ABC-type Fe3+/spermidine/putrescine transport system ATPase subunit
MNSSLVVDSLVKSWPDFRLELSFSCREGEFLTILGPSGSGKSTLLRMIAGLEPMDSGSIVLDGVDVAGIPAHKRRIGLMFQDLALFPHYSVAGNVGYGLASRGIRGEELRRQVDKALLDVDLGGYQKRRVDTLSGGERQRVALARTLLVSPRLILLDEPLSALDEPLRLRLRRELVAYIRQAGILAIAVTHDQTEAFEISDRILIMDDGRIVESGSPEDLKRRPLGDFARDFIIRQD